MTGADDFRQGKTNADGGPTRDTLFALGVILVVGAVVLGGASRENPLRLAGVELIGLAVAALAVRRLSREGRVQGLTLPLALAGLILATPLLQLTPLPPQLWTLLPGQGIRVEALALAHSPTRWLPASLTPVRTGAMALALIPPCSMFLATLCFNATQTRRLAGVWVVLAASGLALGVAQLASPNGGSAYPYAYTNLGSVVGWFANHNHEAAFLLALMPLSAALVTMWRRSPHAQGTAAWPIGLFAAISIVALGVINSRAGIVLAGPAMFAALAVLALGARGRRGASLWIAATVFAGLAILAVVAFGLNPILDRFGGPKVTEVRFEAWPIIADAALAHQPLGAGLGAFELVFQSVEPLGFVGVTFLNHAHNDYLELWLETGWLGLAIFILFAAWLIRAQLIAWRRGKGLARGAGAAILLILAASAVDYPLRTETILVFFAFCCGVLAVETQAAEPRRR